MVGLYRCWFLCLISLCSYSQEAGQRVYLRSERDQGFVSVFTKPGMNWKACPKNEKGECQDAIGWLDANSKIWVTGPKVVAEVKDPYTGEMVFEEYYPVQFEYDRVVDGKNFPKKRGPIGYVDAAFIEMMEVEAAYPEPLEVTSPQTPSPQIKSHSSNEPKCGFKKPSEQLSMKEAACLTEAVELEKAVKEINPKIGMCAQIPDNHGQGQNLYDNAILENLLQERVSSNIRGEGGRKVSQKDLIAIDSLARTLYGEMASCYKHGLHYPMAVARIAINRAENEKEKSNFIRGPHSPMKPDIAKVVTSASQFSMWLKKLNGQSNPALNRGLCPVTATNVKKPNGPPPNKEEMAVWNQSVRIATEAVLFPRTFKVRTERLEKRYFYTSGMGSFYKMKKDSEASIDGAQLSRSKCIEIWYKNQEEAKNLAKSNKSAKR